MEYLDIVDYFKKQINKMNLEEAKDFCSDIYRYDQSKHPEWFEIIKDVNDKEKLIADITSELESPIREFVYVWTLSYRPGQYVSLNKGLTSKIVKDILNCDAISESDKNIILAMILNNHFSDADYYSAEIIATQLSPRDDLPPEVVKALIMYYKNTRRYDICDTLYQKHKNIILDPEYLDAVARKEHRKKPYVPIDSKKTEMYLRFMTDYLNIEVSPNNKHKQTKGKKAYTNAGTDKSDAVENEGQPKTIPDTEETEVKSNTTISSYLKLLKGNRKHKELGKILNINSTTYNTILRGEKDKYISPTITANLCKIFGIDPEDLGLYGFHLNRNTIKEIKKRNIDFDYAGRKAEIYSQLNIYLEDPKERNDEQQKEDIETDKYKIRKIIDIKELRDNNFTLEEIASLYNVTRERIRQLATKEIDVDYSEADLSFGDQELFNGVLYSSREEIFDKYFSNADHDFVSASINDFIVSTGKSFNIAANFLYFKFNQPEDDYSRIFYKNKIFRGISDFSRAYFPNVNPDKVRELIKEILSTMCLLLFAFCLVPFCLLLPFNSRPSFISPFKR